MADEPQNPPEGDGEPQGEPQDTTDWKAEARKHENRAKRAKGDVEKRDETIAELQKQVEDLKSGQGPEVQAEIEKARREGKKEAEAEFDKQRRSDRLEVAVARHARELADVDDVVLNLKASDTDDLFGDDGEVDAGVLQNALFGDEGLLSRKPHLKAAGQPAPQGDPDAGKGASAPETTDPGAAHNEGILASLGLTRQ